jgi:hypothetical protein
MADAREYGDVMRGGLEGAENPCISPARFATARAGKIHVSFALRMISLVALLLLSLLLLAQSSPSRSQLPRGPYRIAGTVANAKTGDPLARARVTIREAKNRENTESMLTSDNGRFEFRVNPGKFSLEGSKHGYISSGYDQHDQYWTAIVTGAGLDTENLLFRLPPSAVLSGKVLDEFGEPVRDARIGVYREDRFSGVGHIRMFRTAQTSDQGEYEVTPLPAGTYFVSVTAHPWYAIHRVTSAEADGNLPSIIDPALDVAYPVTYYGDVTEAEDAAPIPVRGGDRLEADIHLTPVPALHLRFQVPDDGRNGINTPVLEKRAFDGMGRAESYDIQRVSPGVYEMTGVAAGRYIVRMPDSPGQLKEPAEVDLTSGQELESFSGGPAAKSQVKVQIAGDPEPPAGLSILLRGNNGEIEVRAQADPTSGQFLLNDVNPGKYDVIAVSPKYAYSVSRIASASGTTSGHALDVPAGASVSISLTLVEGSAAVEGFVKRAEKPVAGAMIVLVPNDPGNHQELFRRDQSDLDGSFSLAGVVAGSYTVIAIQNGWDLDWAKPAVLAAYLRHGVPIVVPNKSNGPVLLPHSVEVVER